MSVRKQLMLEHSQEWLEQDLLDAMRSKWMSEKNDQQSRRCLSFVLFPVAFCRVHRRKCLLTRSSSVTAAAVM